jgi:hypothetical protein
MSSPPLIYTPNGAHGRWSVEAAPWVIRNSPIYTNVSLNLGFGRDRLRPVRRARTTRRSSLHYLNKVQNHLAFGINLNSEAGREERAQDAGSDDRE